MSEKDNRNTNAGSAADSRNDTRPLSVAPGVRPFTRYKTIELAVCGAAVILGLLYLYADFFGLSVLLPLYCAAFFAVTVLRWLDTRALGMKGFAAMLPVICWGILTAAVIVATAAWFMQGRG